MIALTLLLLAAEPLPVEAKLQVLVLELRDDGVGADAARIIHDTLVAQLSRDQRLEVIAADGKPRADCDDESCLDEIADALAADLLFHGDAGKRGELVVVNLNLYHARSGRSVGRESVEAPSLEALPARLRAAGDRLIAKLRLPREDAPLGPIFLGGAALSSAGAAVAVIGLVVWLPNIQAVRIERTFERKTAAKQAQDAGFSLLIGGGAATAIGLGVLGASLALE